MTNKYAIVSFILKGIKKGQLVLVRFWQKIYLIDNFNANILIDINIMESEIVKVEME